MDVHATSRCAVGLEIDDYLQTDLRTRCWVFVFCTQGVKRTASFLLARRQSSLKGTIAEMRRTVTARLNGRIITISEEDLEMLIATVDDDNTGTLGLHKLVEVLDYIDFPNSKVFHGILLENAPALHQIPTLHPAQEKVCLHFESNFEPIMALRMCQETAQQIFTEIDIDNGGVVDVRELFETLVKFPQLIGAIQKANLLFDDDDDDDVDRGGFTLHAEVFLIVFSFFAAVMCCILLGYGPRPPHGLLHFVLLLQKVCITTKTAPAPLLRSDAHEVCSQSAKA